MEYSVGEVAGIARVSVRALHHYDRIGLLRPVGRTPAGYRRYEPADLQRLQHILAYRDLGFGLDQIAQLLADGAEPLAHLRRQHRLLGERVEALQRMSRLIEKTMEAHQMGIRLDPQEMFEVFGEEDPTRHAEEAEQRWGDTPAYAQSHRRTSAYTKQDWLAVKAEGAHVEQGLAAALASGAPADGVEAMDAAEAHRQMISRWFYDCGLEMHEGLAQMYLADPRFTQHYEELAPGLAQYTHDAIHANAARRRSGGSSA